MRIFCDASKLRLAVVVEGKRPQIQPIKDKSVNVAEYEAIILALEIGLQETRRVLDDIPTALPILELEILSDSQLAIRQINQEYAIRETHLVNLATKVWEATNKIESYGCKVTFKWIPREENLAGIVLG